METKARFTISTPLAAIATLGLFLGMKALITGDFKPVVKAQAAQFEINPVPEDIIAATRVTKITKLKTIDIPPAPPSIKKVSAERPTEKIAEIGGEIPIFDPGGISFGAPNIKENDVDAKPFVRVAAIAPPRAQKSGHCKVRFDVSPDGQTYNIQTLFCSQNMFERPTIKAVARWTYKPKVRGGVAVSRAGVESTMRFNITDERGDIIPE